MSSTEGLDPIIIRRKKLYQKYWDKVAEGQKIILEIEAFLEGVKDPETRTIIRIKYIDGLTWEEVGDVVHMHRTTCYRKVLNEIERERPGE
ncbi:DUF1492 domain-containing protein [Kallipyga massiliensis]|uniref:DUF1492 domain-containing protein n=1 Tax=Kallipyga massiliensis TaxID=1472764 RepID=UPI0009D962CA